MTPKAAELLAAALLLSPDEREELADRMWASVAATEGSADLTHDELAAELNRRHQEFLRDPSVGVTWEDFKRMGVEEFRG